MNQNINHNINHVHNGTLVGKKAPDFMAHAYHDNKFKDIKLSNLKGKWVVLAFYPGDFTFVCPTELSRFADLHGEFKKFNAEILSVSTDSEHVHKAWADTSQSIKKIQYPMLADNSGKIAKLYGVYIDSGVDEGRSLRATFIIDPDGIIRSADVHDNSIGRSVKEILRKLQAANYVRQHGGEVCPVEWEVGSKTLKPGINLVGKI
ncbi:MAG: redoxin domain-containing protein [Nanoarchaeota archaeon]